jgi:SAM-dependent methyltransferase
MRVWNKTLLALAGEDAPTDLDRTFADHARGMGGYVCSGYRSREEFFSTYFDSRLQDYEAFLTAHLPKSGRTLSIASGRAVIEMRLADRGYDVVCSDLEPVCPEPLRALFPRYQFMRWDALSAALPEARFDNVMCLGFVYLLPPDSLDTLMERVAALVAPGCVFILDSAGSPDNLAANFLHEVVLPIDARYTCAALNVRARIKGGAFRRVWRKHHGYRYRDGEFVSAAKRHGFDLEAVSHMDFENEWKRMFLYKYALSRLSPIRAAMLKVGRLMPYVRMFAFRRVP